MMRGARHMAVAVRRPSGEILLHSEPLTTALNNSAWSKLPFVRGLTLLWDTLSLGLRTLLFSANVALENEQVELTPPMVISTLVISLAFVVALFLVGPLLITSLLDRYVVSPLVSNLIEGVIRLIVFLAYVVVIGRLPDIQRVFAYHGAEHKAVNAYEAGDALEIATVSNHSTVHTRCGTSFLLVILVLFVLITSLLGRPPLVWRLISRVLLLPVVAGIAYEVIRFSADHQDNPLVRLLTIPGLALQQLTTREPDQSMVEVAITALKRVLADDGVSPGAQQANPIVPH
ncbi:MAG: DUF1385 domain-containing protein [Chloroflexi bacterium]|nr:DUF1385 domain-containing protein [Chloroflexota bacterium]